MDDPEFTTAVLQNAFDLWFEPEIKRRQEAGTLPKPFPLWAAQVILEPDGPGTMRFNDQIRGVFQVAIDASTPGPIAKGAQLSLSELGPIQGMQLTLDDPNAGHLTALNHKEAWYLLFDFRYNAARIALNLQVAHQFLAAAEDATHRKHLNAAVDNLFGAVETAARSYLMMHPDPRLLQQTTHGFVKSQFNRYGGQLGNVNRTFVELFNTLADIRPKARYPRGPLSVSEADLLEWIGTTKAMLADMDSKRPRRHAEG